jgi:hypothetical protein
MNSRKFLLASDCLLGANGGRRPSIDCLDSYADGHTRLRVPLGKGYTEWLVPLHPTAAAASEVIEVARAQGAIARHDPSAGRSVRDVFVRRGKLLPPSSSLDGPRLCLPQPRLGS